MKPLICLLQLLTLCCYCTAQSTIPEFGTFTEEERTLTVCPFDKDADAIVRALKPHALSLTFVPVPDHAHHDPDELAARFAGATAATIAEALAALPAPRLIAGSLYLAGEALAQNEEAPD